MAFGLRIAAAMAAGFLRRIALLVLSNRDFRLSLRNFRYFPPNLCYFSPGTRIASGAPDSRVDAGKLAIECVILAKLFLPKNRQDDGQAKVRDHSDTSQKEG
jgi:hypothetical protein